MGVDPLQVAQQVEMQRAGLDTLNPAGADAGEMRLGRPRFEIAEHFLLAEQLARGACIVGHEHGDSRAHIRRQTLQHLVDLAGPLAREGKVAFGPLGKIRRHTRFDNVAGMFEVGDKGEYFR